MGIGKKESLKIVVAGLDNAGKTSLLTVLEKIYGFEEIVKFLKPTLGINYTKREYFDKKIIYWDFGGQEEFRQKYLGNKRYFSDTGIVYYLIDIQDDLRYTESVEYLGYILEIVDEIADATQIPVHICFSKSDFTVIRDKSFDFTGKTKMIYQYFKKQYPNFNLNFHYTSIYNTTSIVSVHVRSLCEAIPIFKEIEGIIKEFARDQPILRVIISDRTGLPFINHTPKRYWTNRKQPKIDEEMNYQLQVIRATEDKKVNLNEVHESHDHLKIDFFKFVGNNQTGEVTPLNSIFEEFYDGQFNPNDLQNGRPKKPDKSNYFLIGYSVDEKNAPNTEDFKDLIGKIKNKLSPLEH